MNALIIVAASFGLATIVTVAVYSICVKRGMSSMEVTRALTLCFPICVIAVGLTTFLAQVASVSAEEGDIGITIGSLTSFTVMLIGGVIGRYSILIYDRMSMELVSQRRMHHS